MTDQDLSKLYEDLVSFVSERVNKGQDTMAIAAIMVRLGLEIYKTTLDEQGYNKMVDFISNTRDDIKAIKQSPSTGIH
jgi:hypothetical protein